MNLPRWIDFFDDLQNVRGRSQNTVMAYRRDLELFAEFKQTHSDIMGIYNFMEKRKLSARSQARVISSIRTYYKFCQRQGDNIPDLTRLRPPKVEAKLPRALTMEDYNKLSEACRVDDPYKSARNQVTLTLLFGLGCRVSELIQFNLIDFHEQEAWLKVVGKGGKERLVPLTDHLLQELGLYIRQVRPHMARPKETSILVNDRGKRPSRVDIWRWLDAWSKRAGFEKTIHPHQFRHGCATAMLEAGADLRSIQKLLGHSSIQTTQIYTTVSSKKMQQTIDEHHPLSSVSPDTKDSDI